MATTSQKPTGLVLPGHLDLPEREGENGFPPLILPGHLDLPESDGTFVKNLREHPQSILITESILPVLWTIHPDGRFAIGQDSGIYYREADPVTQGAKAPDWFYVPNVPSNLDGQYRRSYVLWKELVPPRIVLEFVSDQGDEEYDRTPLTGKFWVYEQVIHAAFYGIFIVSTGEFELFHLVEGHFLPVIPNDRGHFPIPEMGVEIGVWNGFFLNEVAPWLRWFDAEGKMLLTGREQSIVEMQRADIQTQRAESEAVRANLEAQRAENALRRADEETRRADEETRRANEETRRAEALAARLRSLGIDPDTIS